MEISAGKEFEEEETVKYKGITTKNELVCLKENKVSVVAADREKGRMVGKVGAGSY